MTRTDLQAPNAASWPLSESECNTGSKSGANMVYTNDDIAIGDEENIQVYTEAAIEMGKTDFEAPNFAGRQLSQPEGNTGSMRGANVVYTNDEFERKLAQLKQVKGHIADLFASDSPPSRPEKVMLDSLLRLEQRLELQLQQGAG